jgi:hypothetical protein
MHFTFLNNYYIQFNDNIITWSNYNKIQFQIVKEIFYP